MQVIHDKSGSLPVTAGELVCFKHPFGNFQGKHLLGSSVSVKFQVIRRKAPASGSFRNFLMNNNSIENAN